MGMSNAKDVPRVILGWLQTCFDLFFKIKQGMFTVHRTDKFDFTVPAEKYLKYEILNTNNNALIFKVLGQGQTMVQMKTDELPFFLIESEIVNSNATLVKIGCYHLFDITETLQFQCTLHEVYDVILIDLDNSLPSVRNV